MSFVSVLVWCENSRTTPGCMRCEISPSMAMMPERLSSRDKVSGADAAHLRQGSLSSISCAQREWCPDPGLHSTGPLRSSQPEGDIQRPVNLLSASTWSAISLSTLSRRGWAQLRPSLRGIKADGSWRQPEKPVAMEPMSRSKLGQTKQPSAPEVNDSGSSWASSQIWANPLGLRVRQASHSEQKLTGQQG
jgi:hypothetical protein